MKLLIVSDTHGQDENLEQVVERESPFDYLIHCGDLEGREDYIEALVEEKCIMVTGNNDYYSDLQPEETMRLPGGHKMLVTHGHQFGISRDYSVLAQEAAGMGCDIACFGHIHIPVLEYEGRVLLVNPGSLTYPRQTGRRPTYAVLEVDRDGNLRPRLEEL